MAQPAESTSTKRYQTSAMSMMGDITDFFETQMQALCTLSESMITMDRFSTDFVSMIKMDGKPIPPPMMTPERIEEMQKYKQQAIELEAKLNLHRKNKLLSKVQAIVDGIDERRTPSVSDITTPECSPVVPDESLQNVDSGMGSSYIQSTFESREKVASTPIERLGDTKEQEDTNDDSGNASGQTILHLDATATDDMVVVGYRSTSSSSDISELNRTVIAVDESDDSLPNSSGSSQTVTEKADSPDSQSGKSISSDNEDTVSPRSSAMEEQHESEANKDESDSEVSSQSNVEQNKEDVYQEFPPVSDTESALSLIGDYKPLPMPERLQNHDPSTRRLDSPPSLPDSSARDSATMSSADETSDAEQWTSSGEAEAERQDEDSKHLISTGSSDLMTYGSAAHSCSLPISCVTDSIDTLRDIKESMDTMNNEILSAVSEEDTLNIRSAPVGQERGDEQTKSAVVGSTSISNNTSSGSTYTGDSMSPLQTVRRRGSYTLDEPSPALLRAHSDKEDSYEKEQSYVSEKNTSARRSLEFTSEKENQKDETEKVKMTKEMNDSEQSAGHVLQNSRELTEKHKTVTRDALSSEKDPNTDITSEQLLELQQQQIDYFEQLRIQLHEQQQQQLQEVLLQQQQEQMMLQKQFEEQERRFEEEQRMLLEQLVRRREKTENEQWLDKLNQLRNLEGRGDSDSESKSSKPNYLDSLEGSQTRLEESPALPPASYRPHTADPALMKYPFYLEGQLRHDVLSDTSHSATSVSSSPQLSVSTPLMSSSPRTKALVRKVASREMKHKFNLVSAVVKGYLTRRLLRTEKVKAIAKTIKDTYTFVYRFQEETPVKRGNLSMQDTKLAERVIAQLRSALLDMHEIFFEIPVYERMAIINHDRILEEERRLLKKQKQGQSKKRVSDATKKVMERRKQVKAVNVSHTTTSRPKTAPPSVSTMKKTPFDARVLKPIQGVQSPQRPADHLYRPAKYTSNRQENRPKTAPEKVKDNPAMQPIGSKVGIHSTSNTITAKSKGARRSLYPVSAVSSKARPKSPRGKTTKRKV